MNLGGYPFALYSTPYQELTRKSGWDWPEQGRIGDTPAMQFTGKQAETMSLRGMLAPGLTGDRSSLELLRALADLGKPLTLVSGQGLFMGFWVITSLEQGEDVHWPDGTPRRMTFSLELKKYGDATGFLGKLGNVSRIAQIFA